MLRSYAVKNYKKMLRQPEGQLKHPFIVPGSVYANQLWDWDCLIQRLGCWSGFLAMWSGIATQERAQRMVRENLLDEKAFWAPWGVSNYLVFRGLVKYGFDREAAELAEKTVALLEKDLAESGELHEYYDPERGEPIINPGFQNWNLLSLNMRAWLDREKVVEEF